MVDQYLLYSSPTLKVVGNNLHLKRILMTFTHWNKRAPVNAGLAASAQMGYVGFVAQQNHWWQVEDLPKAFAKVQSILTPDAKITTFGSSMGGAGALLAAQFLPISTVLSVAPPIIVDTEVAPWEKRFGNVQHLTKCIFSLEPNFDPETRTFIVYDPFYHHDVNHLQLMKQAGRPFQRWPLPHSQHSPLLELAKAGLYRDFTSAFFIDENPGRAYDILRTSRHSRGITQWKWALKNLFRSRRYYNADYITLLSWLIERYGAQIELLEERGLAYWRQASPELALEDFKRCVAIENRGRYTRHVTAVEAALRQSAGPPPA
jgi:pimeloyl-ACP methyl ester carboxylesterase